MRACVHLNTLNYQLFKVLINASKFKVMNAMYSKIVNETINALTVFSRY